MCDSSQGFQNKFKRLTNALKVKNPDDPKEIETKFMEQWNLAAQGKLDCSNLGQNFGPMGLEPKDDGDPKKELCKAIFALGIFEFRADEIEVAKKKIQGFIERNDAAKLYDQWYFGGGSVFGKKLPCSDIRYKGPKNLMKPNEDILGKFFKPKDWSKERYDTATKRLATWDVDF